MKRFTQFVDDMLKGVAFVIGIVGAISLLKWLGAL